MIKLISKSKLINYGFGFPACFKFVFENITPFLTEKILTGHPHDFLIKISLNLIAGILPVRTRGSREGDRFKSVRDSHRSIKKKPSICLLSKKVNKDSTHYTVKCNLDKYPTTGAF